MPEPEVEHVEIPPAAGDARAKVVSRCHALDGFARKSSGAEGVRIDALEAGTTLVVTTRNSHYRFVVLDDPDHLMLVQGGAMFPEPTAVRLEGATDGGSALKMGWIVVGLQIEMSHGDRRIRSSRVRSLAIESVPPVSCSDQRVA